MTNSSYWLGGCGFTSRRIKSKDSVNSLPSAVVTADLNNDQNIDIVVANYGANNVHVLLNVDNGMFPGRTTYSTGSGSTPRSVATADMNGDNKLDIVVANYGTGNVGVLLNTGNGMFTLPMMYSTGSGSTPFYVHAVDVNGDNKTDIIVASFDTDNVIVLLNMGNLMFTIPTMYSTGSYSNPSCVQTADVNGDNKPDILVANYGTNDVGVLLNVGNGMFSEQTTYLTGGRSSTRSVATADLNDDNKLDIIVANYDADNVGVRLNTDNGMFPSQTSYSTGLNSGPISVAPADVNGDNKTDIIVANFDSATIGVLLNMGNGTFTSQTIYSTGNASGPRSLVAADINGDHKLDIIVSNRLADNVGVFLNVGNGIFTNQTRYSTSDGSFPVSVITADINSDNKLDIIVANSQSDNIGIYLDVANGMFTNQITHITGYGSSPRSAVAVDLNGDSTLDIIVANHGTDNVGVLLNMGNLIFTSQTIYSTGLNSGPQSVLTADVNNDNKPDIIVANEGSNSVGVFLNIGNGSFTRQTAYSTAYGSHSYSVATADMNGDSKPDIVVANYGGDNIGVLLNFGNGTFRRQTTFSTGSNSQPSSVVTVDVNGDNKIDVVVANSNAGNIGVLFNVGNGTLMSQTAYSTGDGSNSRSLTTVDMNGDNKPDIIVGNSGKDSVGVLLNLGDGTFAIPAMYSTGYGSSPQSVTTGDVDRDGKPEIIVANYGTNTVDILSNVGNGMFASPMLYSTGLHSYPESVVAADVNGDNKPDIIVVNSQTNTIGVLLNTGNGTFSTQTTYSTGDGSEPESGTIADVNGDNKPDIIVANYAANNIGVFLNTGNGMFTMPTIYSTGLESYPYSVKAVDVNGDNKPDIIVGNSYSNNVGVFLNTGNGTFSTQTTYSTGDDSYPYSVASADMNGDNKPDIIVANPDADNVGVFLNIGQGTFSTQTTYSTGNGSTPYSVATADVDGDNKSDIIVALSGWGAVGVLLSTGNGTFANVMTVQLSDVCAVVVGDINGDSNLDIIYSSCRHTFGVLLNTGNRSFIFLAEHFTDAYTSPFNFVAGMSTPQSLTLADVNGDNKFDIIVANKDMSGVGVFLHC